MDWGCISANENQDLVSYKMSVVLNTRFKYIVCKCVYIKNLFHANYSWFVIETIPRKRLNS